MTYGPRVMDRVTSVRIQGRVGTAATVQYQVHESS